MFRPHFIASAISGASAAYPESLGALRFKNEGVVSKSDVYQLETIPSIYNEGYTYMGQGSSGWSVWRSGLEYLFQVDDAEPYELKDTDFPGHEYTMLKDLSDHKACAAACDADSSTPCVAWVFDDWSPNAGCYLKSIRSPPAQKAGNWAGCSRFCGSNKKTPPSGMRSSVPLGPLGEGSVELRADGRLADWGTIFNNGPYVPDKAWGKKLDVDDAFFGLLIGDYATSLRTHPPTDVPAAEGLRYSGAFPTARLSLEDDGLGSHGIKSVTMNAFSEFHMHAPEKAATPVVLFAFTVESLDTSGDVDASFFFNLPDMLGQSMFQGDPQSLTLQHDVEALKTGNMSWSVVHCSTSTGNSCSDLSFSYSAGASAGENWKSFVGGGGRLPGQIQAGSAHGAAAAQVRVPAGGSVTVTFALSWYFPHRLWGSVDLGHFYQNNFSSSLEVAESLRDANRLDEIINGALAWQSTCFNNTFPEGLQDSLVNTPPTWGKVSFWAEDGRWRNFESHSCTQMEPPHIHFYRALGYELFLPTLERQTPELYASKVLQDGCVSELFGCGCGDCVGGKFDLDSPKGGARGDDNPVFILDVYMNFKWHDDGSQWLEQRWTNTAQAIQFILNHAPAPYNLTYRLTNTNDEHGVIGDVNTYNAFLYLASMAAGARLADAMGDKELAATCREAIFTGRDALKKFLWNSDSKFWTQAYCESVPSTQGGEALQGGGLYGLLWANVLGLVDDIGVDTDEIHAHLAAERSRNDGKYGLIFATNRSVDYYKGHCSAEAEDRLASGSAAQGLTTDFIDEDVWNSHSMTHAAMSIYSGFGTAADALGVAGKVIEAYRETMADQWDYRDTTTPYDDEGRFDPEGIPRPSVNSHYARQTIWWALPLALSGQQYDAQTRPRQLHFAPHRDLLGEGFVDGVVTQAAGVIQWPVLLPHASALANLRATADDSLCMEFSVLSGTMDLSAESTRLTLALPTGARKLELSRVQTGERVEFCSSGAALLV